MQVERRLTDAVAALQAARDIVDGRVDELAPPAWCTARGWDGFLLGLDDTELERCETEGLATRIAHVEGAPPELHALAADVARATEMPSLVTPPVGSSPVLPLQLSL